MTTLKVISAVTCDIFTRVMELNARRGKMCLLGALKLNAFERQTFIRSKLGNLCLKADTEKGSRRKAVALPSPQS